MRLGGSPIFGEPPFSCPDPAFKEPPREGDAILIPPRGYLYFTISACQSVSISSKRRPRSSFAWAEGSVRG